MKQKIEKGKLLVFVSGPSGVGKDTIIEAIRGRIEGVERIPTWTTREPRKGEVHGVDYHFATVEEFELELMSGKFIETNIFANGRYYGTHIRHLQRAMEQGRVGIKDMDVNGVLQMKEKLDTAVYIFIAPKSIEQLEERLVEQGRDDLVSRLKHAKWEISQSYHYDHVVINDTLPEAIEEIETIIRAHLDE